MNKYSHVLIFSYKRIWVLLTDIFQGKKKVKNLFQGYTIYYLSFFP
jgi:hypothetical protein